MFRLATVFLFCLITFMGHSQFSAGIGTNKNLVRGDFQIANGYGLSLDGLYELFSGELFSLETGLGFDLNGYQHIDHYDNVTLFMEPMYQPDYLNRYIHVHRNFEISIPVQFSYQMPIGSNYLKLGLGLNTRWYAFSESRVFLDKQLIFEGNGIRRDELLEKIKFQDLLFVGFPIRDQFELRIQENGLIMSAMGENNFFYRYTDKLVSLNQFSIKILYKL